MKDLSNEKVIHIKKEGIEFIQFRKLLEYKDKINHAYSLGLDKNFRTARVNKDKLSDKDYEMAINSYDILCKSINSSYINLVKTNQEHTSNIKVAKGKINKDYPDFNLDEYKSTDGIVTNKEKLMLSTTNADCISIIFFDPQKKVIANIHSGWRGTIQKVAGNTIDKMIKEFNCNPHNIIACICPSIRKCHFEVDKDVKDMFKESFKDILNEEPDIITKKIKNIKDEKWNIDTVKINEIILEEKGLKKENIIDCKICNVCNSDIIHSYRVEKQEYGLNTALIELK